MDAAFEHMVPAVLMESGGSVADISSLSEAFLALFGVEVERTELEGWLDHLEKRGVVERSGAVSVSASARRSLERRRSEFEQLAATAQQEWRASLIGAEPTVSDMDLDTLVEDLERLIGLMVAYHGAEAAVILLPDEPRSGVLKETLHDRLESLPERSPKLTELRRDGLVQFFSAPTEAQQHYLADRLDHGFFATVGTLRPSAAVALRDELDGQRLYLDTNILISVLGLSGRRVGEPARRLVELTQGLGVQLAVTSRTLEEFQHSLKNTRSELEENLPDRRFAGILKDVARRTGGVSLAEGYLESYESRGSTIADWFRRAAIVEPKLEELEIPIVDDGLTAVLKNEQERTQQYMTMLDREIVSRGARSRSNPTLEHDAVHRLLVERLRGKSHRHFVTAGYWFLTEDKVLPDFGHMALEGERRPKIPFCISASAWAQIARCFTPRTEHYDQMVTDLLASPYVRFGRNRSLGEIQAVVARISTLVEDASPAVVAAFAVDETLEAVARATEQSEKDEVLIHEYEKQEDRLAKKLEAMEQRLQAMEARVVESQGDEDRTVAALRGQLAEMNRQLKDTSAELGLERSRGAESTAKAEAERDAERQRREDDRRKLRGVLVAIACAVLLAVLAVFAFRGEISPGVALITGAMVLALVLGPAIEQSKWAWRVGFVLGVAGLVVSVVDLAG